MKGESRGGGGWGRNEGVEGEENQKGGQGKTKEGCLLTCMAAIIPSYSLSTLLMSFLSFFLVEATQRFVAQGSETQGDFGIDLMLQQQLLQLQGGILLLSHTLHTALAMFSEC